MPLVDGHLAGDDGGSAAVAIFKDLQEVVAFGRIEGRETPVIEDEELHATDGLAAAIATVASGEGERLEQLGTR